MANKVAGYMQPTASKRGADSKDPKAVQKRTGITDRPVRFRCFLANTIYDVLRNRGWQEVSGDSDWDFYWCDVGSVKDNFDHMYLQEHMRINHFRNHYELTKKNLMIKNLRRMKKQVERDSKSDASAPAAGSKAGPPGQANTPGQTGTITSSQANSVPNYNAFLLSDSGWDFFPTSYELPSEYHMFVEEFKRAPAGTVWIMKPAGRAQGKGIFLFRHLKQIMDWKRVSTTGPQLLNNTATASSNTSSNAGTGAGGADSSNTSGNPAAGAGTDAIETYVVQRYIDNPYLLNGRKFDLRVYCLVTSYNPLRCWVYREGFARLTNTRFTLDSLDDTYVHLTNVAVQKTAPDYDPNSGAKWSVQRLREYLTAKHGWLAVRELLRQVDNIFLRSLLSVQKLMIQDKHCFELYGYDILIDDTLKPWLLEINASPSLTASSRDDYELKCRLLDDMLSVIDMEGRLTGKERRVGSFDLIHDERGVINLDEVGIDVAPQSQYNINSFLGGDCSDRRVLLRRIYREARTAQTRSPPQSTQAANSSSTTATTTGASGGQQATSSNTEKVPLSMTVASP